MKLSTLILCTALAVPSSPVSAQHPENVAPAGFAPTREPVSPAGVKAVCDLPAGQHMRNSGGNDRIKGNPYGEPGKGYGLCVFTSCEITSRWQNVPELAGFQKWMEHKPGGGHPQKLDAMIAAFCKEKGRTVPVYVQHTGGDDCFLDLGIKTGRMVCVTYAGSDDFYPGGIDHMVCLSHLDAASAAIIDNNRPGNWVWMSRRDFLARWRARGGGWAVVFLHSPPPPHPVGSAALACVCGDACACKPGECPGKCPVLYGQRNCPNGKCPLPTRAVPTVPAVPDVTQPVPEPMPPERLPPATRPPGPNEPRPGPDWVWRFRPGLGDGWIQTGPDYLWGFTPGKGWDWVPVPVRAGGGGPAPVLVGQESNFGVDRDKIHQRPTYSLAGPTGVHEIDRDAAHAAVAGGSLADDSDRWHLAAVGDAAFVSAVRADVRALPDAVRGKLHVQAYDPGAWAVPYFKLPPGLSLRKPGRASEQVGTLAAAEYSPVRLAEFLAPVSGLKPTPVVVPKRPDPVPATPPTDPVVPPPVPNTPPGGGLLLFGFAAAILWLLFRRR